MDNLDLEKSYRLNYILHTDKFLNSTKIAINNVLYFESRTSICNCRNK